MKVSVVPLFNMELRLSKHRSLIEQSIKRVLDSSQIILGQEVENFEQKFAEFIGAKQCISVANGTDAIELSLRSLHVNKDSCVGLAANAGGYSRIAVESLGAKAIYADVDDQSQCLSYRGVSDLIARGASTIVVTHLYGRVAPEIVEIAALCKNSGVNLVEDCAQAHGSFLQSAHAGTFGDLATFSFYPTKNLGAIGDGGCVTTDNVGLANSIRALRTYGWTAKYDIQISGGRNSRLDALQAAILSDLLPILLEENNRRREIAKVINSKLTTDLVAFCNADDKGCNFHLFILRSEFRNQLRIHLEEHGIQSAIHYPIPDHLQEGWRSSDPIHLPVTEQLASEILTIPTDPNLSDLEIERIIHAINEFSLN
jgi:dTDP-4-amino-4,6-dideoxygalactose transaminase